MDQSRSGCFYVVFWLLFIIKYEVNCQGPTDTIANVTFIENAVEKGAVCLDGSPGAYYFSSGSGDGLNNWIIQLQGGGWCESTSSCLYRSTINLGSTKKASVGFFGTILSLSREINPDLYNWNKVFVLYCDGASFMADVADVDPETKLHLRGRRIFRSVMEELLATKGLDKAENALLYGSSAGGLATILNCDSFRSYLPIATRVKCFSDSGFFIRAKDVPASIAESFYGNVTAFHDLAKFLPEACTSKLPPNLCLFAEYVVGDVQTPLFLLNSDFDQYQIQNNLQPNSPDEQDWKNRTANFEALQNCTLSQLQIIKDFQIAFLKTWDGVVDNPSRGLFINSYFIHGFVAKSVGWQGGLTVQNKTIQQAFGDWYFDRSSVQFVDKQHPDPINPKATTLRG